MAYTARAQTPTITYACKATRLETVVDYLARETGLYFVYSSDKIAVNHPVSIAVTNASIDQVLSIIGKQLNLSFKLQGHHVMIKAADVPVQVSVPPAKKLATITASMQAKPMPVIDASEIEEDYYTDRFADTTTLRWDAPPQSLMYLRSSLDSALRRDLPTRYIRKHNHDTDVRSKWFLSAGGLVNDYSAGLELNAGLPYAYIVMSPTLLQNGSFHGAFGVGSSISVAPRLSINPVYTYATVDQTNVVYTRTSISASRYEVEQTIKHHQVKLMVQYSFSKNFVLKLGPAINKSITTFGEQRMLDMMIYQPANVAQPVYGSNTRNVSYGMVKTINITSPAPAQPEPATKVWFGWEASLSYRLFFPR